MKQYTENQYDDDLTVGTDEYDDSYHTDVDDLFEFSTDEESPISRLKSLILSIDWEITDDVLMQFNEELVNLRGIWAGEKINLVYVQALEKISKYIYHKKAASHPSAIKLLLTFYHNLEKIVSSEDLSDQEKKEILLKDVKRFENLKREIGKQSEEVEETEVVEEPTHSAVKAKGVKKNELLALKAIVLGIDWEITDKDLSELRLEVDRLEEKYVNDKPRLILLQGIGTLGAYIKLKKSNSHPDAFKVLHLFYDSLEKLTLTPMDHEEEKAILLPAVETFNSFKIQLGTTISDDGLSRNEKEVDVDMDSTHPDVITPAFADIPEEEIRGFQAEEEAQALGLDSSGHIGSEVETFFTDEGFLSTEASTPVSVDNGETVGVEEMIGAAEMFAKEEDHAVISIAKEVALQGVNVEEEDEEDLGEHLTVEEDGPAPALSFEDEEPEEIEESAVTLPEEKLALKDGSGSPAGENKESAFSSDFSDGDESGGLERNFSKLDREVALQGVDVETEADEGDDDEALPMEGEEVAPALAENDEVSIYNAENLEQSIAREELNEEIVVNLDNFFDEKPKTSLAASTEEINLIPEPEVEEMDPQGMLPSDSELEQNIPEDVEPGILVDGDDEDKVPAELDQQLDSFFDLGETVEQPEDESLLLEFPEESDSEDIVVTEKVIFTPALSDMTDEEEVVFELAEDDESFSPAVAGVDESEFLNELSGNGDVDSQIDKAGDTLGVLRTYIESLEGDVDSKVVEGIYQEINVLRQALSEKPVEKTFLQLLSTVTQHINQKRNGSSDSAYGLLQSVCNALNDLQDDNQQHNQELLLEEVSKVLEWQQGLLVRQNATQGES